MNNVLLKTVEELLQLAMCSFRMTEYIIEKLRVPSERVTVFFIKV
jgi:hypothetical protein